MTVISTRPQQRLASNLLPLLALVVFLLFAGWLRTVHIVDFFEWPDEIWSLWHVQGSFREAMSRVPYDWPPLFSAISWGWMQLAGLTLEASRYLTILFALLSMVFVFRAAKSLFLVVAPTAAGNRGAAWVALAAGMSMGYLIFSGVEVRAYGLVLLLGALALWMTLRWLRKPESWRRTVLVALVLALTFYSTFTSALYVLFLTVLVVIVRPRLLLRWIGVGIFVVIFTLPILPQFLGNALSRLDVMAQPPDVFGVEMVDIFTRFGGTAAYAAIIGVALLVVIYYALRRKINARWAVAMMIWLIVPAVIYVIRPNREYLNVRYMWWVALGLVMLLGMATLYLPRWGQWAAIALLLGLTFLPVDWLQFRAVGTEAVPMRMVLSWFQKHIRPGDVLIEDPKCVCGTSMAWDYFLPQFFPQGDLPFVDEPGDHSRVWYLSTTGWPQDEPLKAAIMKGRKESIFVGPWNFLLRLYEGPPLWQGAAFDNQIALNGFEIPDDRKTFRENEDVSVKLWWSALRKPAMDYSFSLSLFDEFGNLIAQSDGSASAPDTPQQTSAWEPGTYYEDYRTLHLPIGIPGREYTLMVTVYDWQTNQRLVPAANTSFKLAGPDSDYLLVQTIEVVAY